MTRLRASVLRGLRALAGLGAAAAVLLVGFALLPLPAGLLERGPAPTLRVLDRHGGLLREVRARADGRAVALPDGPLPPQVRDAFVAAEDRRFGRHPGVDPLAIARALVTNVRAGRVVSGASTIPQQLARQLVPRERTL
ncbi:MAG: transglycosylase domain-containing protein, partial [Myxococcales bacterium]